MSMRVTLILGTSNLFADAVSMAFGDFLSTRADFSHRETIAEQTRKVLARNPTRLKSKLVAVFKAQGLTIEDAETVVTLLSRSPKLFSQAVLSELNVYRAEEQSGVPLMNGVITLVSFIAFGSVPLLTYSTIGNALFGLVLDC